MKKKILVLALSLLITLAACGQTPGSGSSAAPAEASQPASSSEQVAGDFDGEIVIGSILDTSGNMAVAGQATVWGADYAVNEINENGGIGGKKLRIVHYDVKGDPNEAINAYNRLVDQDKAVAVVGPGLSNIGIALAPIAEQKKVPIVSHFMDERATTNEQTGEAWKYIFLAEPSCNQQAEAIASYTVEELKVKTAAVLYDSSNAYSVTHAIPFKEYCQANGVEIVAEESFGKDAKDYKAQISKIIAAKPEAVFVPAYVQQNALAYKQLRQLGYTGLVVGNNTYNQPFNTLIEGVSPEGLYFIFNVDYSSEYTKFLGDAYKAAKNGEEPQINVAFGYDNVKIIANALAMSQDTSDTEALADIIANKTVEVMTASGPITLDPKTHRPVGMGVYISQWDEKAESVNLLQYYMAK
ncbi:ABC transporter substrate-binding protein [Oscillospiraceae bacterium MB08-C2-2]|nr:ABC transporter substrate-binding protein [Oscillospiraceae bacterium MB08-C2-2]